MFDDFEDSFDFFFLADCFRNFKHRELLIQV